jgi:murein DD-endopeptidase MepM/ murein hydrolase activator NlpD
MLLPFRFPSSHHPRILLIHGLLLLFGLLHLQSLKAADTIRCQLADGFDYPVGKPDAKGYYKYRGFWPNGHLGEDWNGVGGGNTDLGDPIYSIGKGVVVLSEDIRVGWGNCVIVRHAFRDASGKIEMIDSLYAHLHERKVKLYEIVERGQLVGTMGGNRGMYSVHLHFEIRKNLKIGMNRSQFARDYSNYHSPTTFINAHRTLQADLKKFDIPVKTFAAYGKTLAELPADDAGKQARIPVFTPKKKTDPGPDNTANPVTSEDDFWSRLKGKLSSPKKDANPQEKDTP